MTRLPTFFLSHGSPMHALEAGPAGSAWREMAASIPRPRAVLIASAHWETSSPTLTGARQLATIHDFGGFPDELYALRYDAPGAPDIARRAAELLRAAGHPAEIDASRGIDHGAWVPLRRMYPDGDVPVVQLSIQPSLGPAHHWRVGEALGPLADEAVLVIGSGHVTHNLRDWFTAQRDTRGLEYVPRFADWLCSCIESGDRDAVLDYRTRRPEAARAHPTEEHFLPLFIAWGAAGSRARGRRVHRSIDAGALSMDAYRFDPAA